MNVKIWTLSDYLVALENRELESGVTPFDLHLNVKLELGPAADNLKLFRVPPKKYMPPDSEIILEQYQMLQPVLEELFHVNEFKHDSYYDQFSSNEVAKAYLGYVVNKTLMIDHWSDLRQQMAYQCFLNHVIDAIVEGVVIEQAVDHISNHEDIRDSLDSIVDMMTIDYPSKAALMIYLNKQQLFNIAYKCSLMDENEMERVLSLRLHTRLLESIERLKSKKTTLRKKLNAVKTDIFPNKAFVEVSSDLILILDYYNALLTHLLKIDSPLISVSVLEQFKESPFFAKLVADIPLSSPKTLNEFIKNIQLAITSAKKHVLSHSKRKLWLAAGDVKPPEKFMRYCPMQHIPPYE